MSMCLVKIGDQDVSSCCSRTKTRKRWPGNRGVVTSIWIHLAGSLTHLLYPLVDQQGSGNFPLLEFWISFLMEIDVSNSFDPCDVI